MSYRAALLNILVEVSEDWSISLRLVDSIILAKSAQAGDTMLEVEPTAINLPSGFALVAMPLVPLETIPRFSVVTATSVAAGIESIPIVAPLPVPLEQKEIGLIGAGLNLTGAVVSGSIQTTDIYGEVTSFAMTGALAAGQTNPATAGWLTLSMPRLITDAIPINIQPWQLPEDIQNLNTSFKRGNPANGVFTDPKGKNKELQALLPGLHTWDCYYDLNGIRTRIANGRVFSSPNRTALVP